MLNNFIRVFLFHNIFANFYYVQTEFINSPFKLAVLFISSTRQSRITPDTQRRQHTSSRSNNYSKATLAKPKHRHFSILLAETMHVSIVSKTFHQWKQKLGSHSSPIFCVNRSQIRTVRGVHCKQKTTHSFVKREWI